MTFLTAPVTGAETVIAAFVLGCLAATVVHRLRLRRKLQAAELRGIRSRVIAHSPEDRFREFSQ